MKKAFVLFVLFLISVLFTSMFSQNKENTDRVLSIPGPEDYVLNNSSLGTDFWLAIPQNEVIDGNLTPRGVEIVVTSPYSTEITLEIPEVGYTRTKKIEAFGHISFSSEDNDITYAQEVTESEQVTREGIHLKADKPFACWVVNSKRYSAEAFQGVPTSKWGREYYHCAYYDFDEGSSSRGGGFIIVAKEAGTNVKIDLKGLGAGQTVKGKKIGESISVTLNAGDTYMVRGDGTTRGQFDISGSKITASKPVGVISFHMRTMIPSLCPEDRDNLNEMLTPVEMWGKSFHTIQFDRKTSGSRTGKGDLFRIINKESNTKVECEFYDIQSYLKAGNRTLPMNQQAMIGELDPITDINNANDKTSIFGMAIWSSDKPVQLIQNAFSNRWDGDNKWSPMSVIVPPTNQYVRSVIFATPLNTGFQEHQMTLIAKGDKNDPNNIKIRSIILDGEDLVKKYPQILQNVIPNTDYHWIRINITTGAHTVQSSTEFYAYLVGFDAYNAYGYPIAQGFNIISDMDTSLPAIRTSMDCGNYTLTASEIVNGGTNDVPRQVDAGLSEILLLSESSHNYSLTIKNPHLWKPENKISQWEFYLDLIDNSKPGKAVYAVMDRAGNIFIDSVSYDPPKVSMDPISYNFGKIILGKDSSLQVCIKNQSNDDYKVNSITNSNPKYVLSGLPTLPITLKRGDSILISVKFAPSKQAPTTIDIDTIRVGSDCLNLTAGLRGSVIYPKIAVDKSFDFGKILKGEQVCMESINNKGLKITNTGTSNLTVYSVAGISVPFLITSPTVPALPISIMPDSSIYLKSICYIPQDTIKSELTFTISSNAIEGDSTSSIAGEGYIKQDTTSVEDETIGLSMKITPNPANENFTISWENISNHSMQIDILSLQGLVIESFKPAMTEISGFVEFTTKDIPSGLYLIRMTNQLGSISRKLVILK